VQELHGGEASWIPCVFKERYSIECVIFTPSLILLKIPAYFSNFQSYAVVGGVKEEREEVLRYSHLPRRHMREG